MTAHFPAAVLFDMDGTLVDTEPYWMTAERELVVAYDGTWTAEDGLTLVGQGLENSAAILQSRGVDLTTSQIIDHLTERVLAQAKDHIPWQPGALELIASLRDAKIPLALVTMSMRPLAEHIVHASEEPLFDLIVSGGDVVNPKPHPEPYHRAADLLGVEISECVAIEDSIPGLASAVASGATVIGVPAHIELAASDNYTLWESLAGRTIHDIRNLATSGESRTIESEPTR
ncbi:MAG: HAD family phosphatase [Terrimesophilobacter sp.]